EIGTSSRVVKIAVTVNPVNDAPAISGPTNPVLVGMNSNATFSGASQIQVADDDLGANPITVEVTVSVGTLTLGTVANVQIVSGSNGSGAVEINGTLAAVNSALNNL